MERITKEELLEMLFHDDYEQLKGKKLRMTRVRVPGKEVCLAHVISPVLAPACVRIARGAAVITATAI